MKPVTLVAAKIETISSWRDSMNAAGRQSGCGY
jgi:hypothetical protein